jgi:hypothetical protein
MVSSSGSAQKHKCHIGLVYNAGPDPRIRTAIAIRRPIWLIARPDHPLARRGGPVGLHEIADLPARPHVPELWHPSDRRHGGSIGRDRIAAETDHEFDQVSHDTDASFPRDIGGSAYEMKNADWVVTLPFLGDPFGALATIVYGEIVPSIKALAAGREAELHAVGAGIVGMSNPSFVDFAAAHAQAETLRSAFAGFFQKYDVLLTPVNPMTGRQWRDGPLDPRHGGDAIQPDRSARAFGALRLQLREAADRYPAGRQVAG